MQFNLSTLHNEVYPNELEFSRTIGIAKYRLPHETHRELCARVAGVFFDKHSESEKYLQCYNAMLEFLWMPAGRILAGAGTDKRVTMMNCFSGDTKIITSDGLNPLKYCDPENVLTRKGWVESKVQSFGVQELLDYTFQPVMPNGMGGKSKYRRTVRATRDHRWILNTGKETTKLDLGHKVPAVGWDGDIDEEVYRAGFKHGFVFGDGTHNRTTLREISGGYPLGTMHFILRLCGAKADYLPWFADEKVGYPPACKGDPVVYMHSVEDLKAVPLNMPPSYIKGFIEGWNAADGSALISGEDSTSLFSKNIPALEWLADHAPYAGYAAVGLRRYSSGETNYDGKGELWVCTLRKVEKVLWEVVSIKAGPTEQVFCAVVPGEAEFVLEGGILTGNCFVTGTVEDSMEGIMREHTNFTLTMQQGGGDGIDFSPIRPAGAILKRTGTKASGPLPFADMWDAMCMTIMSAGDRRGAMMATIADTHPDMPAFIKAKQQKNRLKRFNLSVLISDAFMSAIEDDSEWLLYFPIAPMTRDQSLVQHDFEDDDGVMQYVYSVWRARDLWEMITKYTYEYSEPGVIFIDRVNEMNNLSYCETIRCTNPCGEQPLPPHGACDLGHVNLARLVKDPFTAAAQFDYETFTTLIHLGVDFLDRVIDITNYPLPEQETEQKAKRRIGLGITGLADVFAQMGMRYGSWTAIQLTRRIMEHLSHESYRASINLAKEKGSFPMYDDAKYFATSGYAVTQLPKDIRAGIGAYGIRNGVINTVAPTGTTSIYYGNVSGGLEPNFAHKIKRNVLQEDDSLKAHYSWSYSGELFRAAIRMGIIPKDAAIDVDDPKTWPPYMDTMDSLTLMDHMTIMSEVQRYVDASVSKTINLPKDMPYEQFVQVYDLAYKMGCKGCTTYRPSDVRGSILENADALDTKVAAPELSVHIPLQPDAPIERPEVLSGTTYKIKWPNRGAAFYVIINDYEGKPFELFITSKDSSNAEWTTALSLMITALFRKGGDISFIAAELKQIQSIRDGAWVGGKYVVSLPAYLGELLERHITKTQPSSVEGTAAPQTPTKMLVKSQLQTTPLIKPEICPKCNTASLSFVEGCKKCGSCGYSEC